MGRLGYSKRQYYFVPPHGNLCQFARVYYIARPAYETENEQDTTAWNGSIKATMGGVKTLFFPS